MAHPPGLRRAQFHRIAEAGFNDPCNAYPHSMCWFRDHLYVGTTRCVLHLLYNRFEALKAWPVFPIKPAKNVYRDLDIRAQIWRYAPDTGAWTRVLASPMTKNTDGVDIPCFQGIRNMMVYQAVDDDAPCLYAMTWSPQKGPGPMLLRSEDGVNFESIPMAGRLASQFSTFRPMVEFRGRLFTAPTGRTGSANSAGVALVMETDNPRAQAWVQANPDNFGDAYNETIFEMGVFNDHLYATTMNQFGFQLWKTDAQGAPPYRWTRVLQRGAERGPLNEGVGALCAFNNALYIGSVINNGGYDRKYGIGPGAVEILRVHPDDSWDLVVGEGRATDDGLKMPLSGLGAGFDKFFNSYLWRLCAHDGWIYAGTFSWSALLPYLPRDRWPDPVKQLFDRERTDLIIGKVGGCDLWRSRNGATWLPVTVDGFGNPYNWGVRALVSTPRGLFVGTANPFGPEVAVPRNGTWRYEANPRGGCEIWLGAAEPPPPSNLMPEARSAGGAAAPAASPDDTDAFVAGVIDALYGHTGHRALGCWTNRTASAAEACDNLVDELLAFRPEAAADTAVAFGGGAIAVARRMRRALPNAALIAVEPDRRGGKAESAGDTIRRQARADDACAGLVLSAEALSRRPDGLARMREAIRALKPGGWFVGMEVLSAHPDSPWRTRRGWRSDPVTETAGFAALLKAEGLADVEVLDRSADCWTLFRAHLGVFLWQKRLDNELDEALQEAVQQELYGAYDPFYACVFFRGRRPA